MDLMHTSSLVFERDSIAAGGYYQAGEWVDSPTTPVTTKGSLQPAVREGEKRQIEARGFSSDDAKVYYTDTLLRTTSQFDKTNADRTTIKNHTYEVLAVKDWDTFDTTLDHYEVLLVRKDLDAGG
jgi:hypothetical protein